MTLKPLVALFAVLLATPAVAGSLTPEQAAAKQQFDESMQSSIDNARKTCGVDFTFATDFEHFDAKVWSEGDPGNLRQPPERNCKEFVDEVARHCRSEGGREPKEKAGIVRSVKGLACVFAGYRPKTSAEGSDIHAKNNMSLVNGVFTMRSGGMLRNVQWTAGEVLSAALHKADGTAQPVDTSTNRENGSQCKDRSMCESGLCVHGLCKPCGGEYSCPSGMACYDNGMCRSSREMAAWQKSQDAHDQRGRDLARAMKGHSCTSHSQCGTGGACLRGTCH